MIDTSGPDGGPAGTGTTVVLLVDDEAAVAEATAEMLEREGDMEVRTETRVGDGLDRLAEEAIDCVVSDYQMPEMDGLEFLAAVREEYPELPFVLFTGQGSESVASEAFSAGATDYVQKDAGTGQYAVLANRVRNAVETARMRTQRRHHRQAIETAHEGISILDEDGRFVYVNQRYADQHGYDREELLGADWDVIYPEDEMAFVYEEVVPAVREAGAWRGETTSVRADGSRFVADHAIATTGDGSLVCTIRDITDRKEREEELAETNRILRTMLEALPVGALVENSSREVLAANATFCDLLDVPWSPAELEGRDCEAAAEAVKDRFADPEKFVTNIEARLDRRERVANEELELADGRTLERDYVPYTLPKGDANLWLYRDVTERKEHEATLSALHEATRDFMAAPDKERVADRAVETASSVLDQPVCGLWLYDEDDDVLRPVAESERSREMLDGAPTYPGGESLSWQAFDDGEVRVYDDLHEVAGRLNEDTEIRSEIILPLGEHGVMNFGSTEPGAFSETDVSLARVLANTVASALTRADRESELRAQRRALERQNERLDGFASIVSHDLRNPLNVATGRLELAQADCDSEHLEKIDDALSRMGEIIDDTLTLAKQGEAVGDVEAVDVGALARQCWDGVGNGGATLDVEDEIAVRADPERVKHVFENLFRNSVDHGHRNVTVRIGRVPDGFYVADDGPGIPEGHRHQVFEPGYSTSNDGTGFGLNIVKQIAEAHGWTVTVTDGADGGARFEFTGVEFADR